MVGAKYKKQKLLKMWGLDKSIILAEISIYLLSIT